MPLVTGWTTVNKEVGVTVPNQSSRFYVAIFSSLLSEPYELVDGDMIKGQILRLVESGTIDRTEFRDMPITLILKISVGFDLLFISKNEWETSFRDRGLVLPNYQLQLKLIEAAKANGKAIKLYPQKDFGAGS